MECFFLFDLWQFALEGSYFIITRLTFAGEIHLPKTMEAYQMRGTPSLILIDKSGHLRAQHFGDVSELRLGAEIGSLLTENRPDKVETTEQVPIGETGCDETGCAL